nr:MAG TPA: hypothetical protein [Caudoviricetes sp.]
MIDHPFVSPLETVWSVCWADCANRSGMLEQVVISILPVLAPSLFESGVWQSANQMQITLLGPFLKNFYARDSKPTITTIELLCNGLGIALAQFFDESGESVSLTAEQQHVLDRWDRISDEEKQIISGMLDVMVGKKD